jgi:hypothetical protein
MKNIPVVHSIMMFIVSLNLEMDLCLKTTICLNHFQLFDMCTVCSKLLHESSSLTVRYTVRISIKQIFCAVLSSGRDIL